MVTENVDQKVSCLKKELQLGNGEKTIVLTETKNILLQDEKLNSSRIETYMSEKMFDLDFISSQDEDLVNVLELQI